MATVNTIPPVYVRMSHMKELPLYKTEIPYEIWAENFPSNGNRTNVELQIVDDIALTDVRKLQGSKPSLDTHGFEYIHQKFPEHCGIRNADDIGSSGPDQADRIAKYLENMIDLLQETYGCSKVLCFDWRVRRVVGGIQPEAPNIYSLADSSDEEPRADPINAAHVIHADGAPGWMKMMVANILSPIERAQVMENKQRIRAITVWRPLVAVVENEPLAVCDTQTILDSDWEVIEKILDEAVEESMYLKRRERHRWYWMENQTRDDVLVLSVWDSQQPDSPSCSVPHCAVMLPGQNIASNPRESIEMRFLIFTDH